MPDRIALVIANYEFEDPKFSRLVSPSRDAEALVSVLGDAEIGGFQTIPLVNEEYTVIRNQIDRLYRKRRKDDLLLLYYSGHGIIDDDNDLYLAARDTREEMLSSTTIEAEFIRRLIDKTGSRRNVVILDCCHSGAFSSGGAKAVLGSSIGLQEIISGSGYGRVTLTASNALEYSWEGDRISGSASELVFTHFLVQGLQTGAADINKDGAITLDELYDYVYDQVLSSGGKRQTPQKFAQRVEGQLIIARSVFQSAQAVKLPSELQAAIENPLAYVREGAVKELGTLLTNSDPRLVQAAREALEGLAQDDSRKVSKAAREMLARADSAEPQTDKPEERKPRVREKPPDLDIRLSYIPEHPVPLEDVRWTVSVHNRGKSELVDVQVLHQDEPLRAPVNLLPGRYRRFTTFAYYAAPGEHQERFQVVVRALSGAVHRVEASQMITVHPPQPETRLAGEVDLSGRIEVHTRPSVLAFADGASFSVSVSGAEKEAAYQALKRDRPGRSALKLRIMIYTALLYLLLKDHAPLSGFGPDRLRIQRARGRHQGAAN